MYISLVSCLFMHACCGFGAGNVATAYTLPQRNRMVRTGRASLQPQPLSHQLLVNSQPKSETFTTGWYLRSSAHATSTSLCSRSKSSGWAQYYRERTVDKWLSRLTTAFPLFVVVALIMALAVPSTLAWVNTGSTVTLFLAAVMWGTGLTLQQQDFANVWASPSNRAAIPLGIACQFGIMPLSAWFVGQAMFLRGSVASVVSPVHQALFVGLCLVGCAPGGTASNLVSLIAGANVALSVILTTCSTLAAVVVTPLLVKLLVQSTITSTATTTLAISGWALCAATAKVVVVPIVAGMWFKARRPKLADQVGRFTPFASVLLVSLICGGVVAQTAPLLSGTTSSVVTTAVAVRQTWLSWGASLALAVGIVTPPGASLIPILIALPLLGRHAVATTTVATAATNTVSLTSIGAAVLMLHTLGFGVGYIIPKTILPRQEKTARTIAIEVGMQNSALAVILARSIPGLHPAAALPGAISATVHSCLGSVLAACWRLVPARDTA